MKKFIQDKVSNRFRQYGLRAAGVQLVKAAFRRIYEAKHDLIFVIPDFAGYSYQADDISSLSRERINQALAVGELDRNQAQLLNGFLDTGCIGLCAEADGKLAGYAWVQFKGEYTFGRTGRMIIPSGYAIVKNLFVAPEFRGRKLGQKLNAARLTVIPAGVIPAGFIIPENRYAIRNWEKYGFERVLKVKLWRCLRGNWKMSVERLKDCPEADSLTKALNDSNDLKTFSGR